MLGFAPQPARSLAGKGAGLAALHLHVADGGVGGLEHVVHALLERVAFDASGVTSLDWSGYPILRFSEVPQVEVEVIQRSEIEPVGAGEAAHGPVTAAIANAVFDCLGIRVRQLPITRDSLIAAMEQS